MRRFRILAAMIRADKLFLTEYFGEVKDSLKEKTPPTGVKRTAGT